ncbi:hypothetical protein HDE_04453 [Halotydeus destructor]|nr:hypothetical protein HDE_04453 [Halotydeus destructor]
MQSEIEKESSLLEQIMPESNEKLKLVEGMSKNEDEKYNWRHYFTYRVDELPGHRDAGDGTRDGKQEAVAYGLMPDYYKDGGDTCPSTVSFVQPRRARNVDGMWKIILNLRGRYRGVDRHSC